MKVNYNILYLNIIIYIIPLDDTYINFILCNEGDWLMQNDTKNLSFLF